MSTENIITIRKNQSKNYNIFRIVTLVIVTCMMEWFNDIKLTVPAKPD